LLCFTHRVQIDVPSTALRSGSLLELGRCARHDAPATRSRTRRFTTELPGVVVLLALFSLFLVLLVAAAFQKDVRGAVPECDRCAASYRRRITVMWAGILGALALVVVSLAQQSGVLFLAGVVLLLVGVVSGVRADLGRVRGTLTRDLAWVELRGVDATFAAAVQERIKVAPSPDPWVTPLT
jgi:hypothetical protein